MIKRHTRPNHVENINGAHPRAEGRFHVSNVMPALPGMRETYPAAGHTTLPDGTKVRTCRRCDTTFES